MSSPIKAAQQREAFNRLTNAVVLSLLLHFGFYAAMDLGKKLDWFQQPPRASLSKWLKPPNLVSATASPAPWPIQPKRQREEMERAQKKKPIVPDRFIEVDTTLSIIDPPDDPKYYSTHTTRAADPNPRQTKENVPKVDGEQSLIPKIIAFAQPVVAPFTTNPDNRLLFGKTLTPVPPLEIIIRPQGDATSDFKPSTAINLSPASRDEPPSETAITPAPSRAEFAKLTPFATSGAPSLKLSERTDSNEPARNNPSSPSNLAAANAPFTSAPISKTPTLPEANVGRGVSLNRPTADARFDFKPAAAINPSPSARNETPGEATATSASGPARIEFTKLTPLTPTAPGALGLKLPEAPNGNGSSAPSPSPKPRTLLEAKASQAVSGALAGKKMIQDGGVNRPGKLSFDVIGVPYGPYDALFFSAVQQRWWDLLDNGRRSALIPGEIRLSFLLHHDGRITDLKLINTSVTEFQTQVCPATLQDLSPFLKWPDAMREAIGDNKRQIRFRFIYW